MISIRSLNFKYQKEDMLFSNLDLDIDSGKICGLLGKNGSGKTTLLRHIVGLLFPDSGEVIVHGFPSLKRNPDMLKELFYVQEEFELPSMYVKRYVGLNATFYEKFDYSKFWTLLDIFEVSPDKHLSRLSFGQRKKVQISFALSSGVDLLLMDEPTNGLDIPSKAQFRKVLISGLSEDQSVIISSHQVRDLANLLDQVIILDEGKIVLNEDIFDISRVLDFQIVSGKDLSDDVIYSEMVPGGHAVVIPNQSGKESSVEIESLFNAVIAQRERVHQLFDHYKNPVL